MSKTREDCESAVKNFAAIINSNVVEKNKILYVGTAGDPPGGEYSRLFNNAEVTTFDKDSKWNPDIVGDICSTLFENNTWNTIICVQVIEHIPNIWKLPGELFRILKPKGYIIIDCPWNYPYHAEPPSFKDYWRISKDGMVELFFPHFTIERLNSTESNTSCLLRKN